MSARLYKAAKGVLLRTSLTYASPSSNTTSRTGHRVLLSGGLNQYKPSCPLCFTKFHAVFRVPRTTIALLASKPSSRTNKPSGLTLLWAVQISTSDMGRLDRGPGAVRPPYPGTGTREKNSNFSSPDLPIHPMDCSETLGKLGIPHGYPVAKRSSPKTHRIMRNRKSTLKNTSSRVPKKNVESKAFPRI